MARQELRVFAWISFVFYLLHSLYHLNTGLLLAACAMKIIILSISLLYGFIY